MEKIRRTIERGDLSVGIYTILGYPNLRTSLEALRKLEEVGVTIFETAIPPAKGHSDDLGSTIRAAHMVSCLNKVSWIDILNVYSECRPNLYIMHQGTCIKFLDELLEKMEGKVDSILIGWREENLQRLHQVASSYNILLMASVSVDMSTEKMRHVIRFSDDLVYLAVAPGTGGCPYSLQRIKKAICTIRSQRDSVICCGYGIRTPEQAKSIGSLKGCDGIMIGTAALEALSHSLRRYGEYVKSITQACQGVKK